MCVGREGEEEGGIERGNQEVREAVTYNGKSGENVRKSFLIVIRQILFLRIEVVNVDAAN